MKNKNRYPQNWNEIALSIKQEANWTCQRCGLKCCPEQVKSIKDRSEKAKRVLTVHHSDYDPANNKPDNLIPLCTACHLYYHRGGKPNVHPNQLKLNLGV